MSRVLMPAGCLTVALALLAPAAHACQCQSSYAACNEVAVSNLVFIGTVESISPAFLNRWNATSRLSLRSLNDAYLDALDHPSEGTLARLKEAYFRAFPDLAADEKQRLLAAKTTSDVSSFFYSTLNDGQRIRLKVKTLFKHEEDDADDGEAQKYFDVSTPFGDCGVEFEAGETYLVYANNDENSGLLSTTRCTRTRRLSDAGGDLSYLFFYRNQREESARLEGFTTTDRRFPMDLDKLHDPETVKAPVAGVTVELHSERLTRYAESDSAGRFVFDGLGEGDYSLSVFAQGYPSNPQLLAGPTAFHVEPKSCVLQVLVLPKPGGK